MSRIVKCRFCRREIRLKEFRTHLRTMHPDKLREKVQEPERVDTLNEASLLMMFTTMEILNEQFSFEHPAEPFEGKGGEFGGGGASGDFECSKGCESCELHKESESEPGCDSQPDDSGSSDSGSSGSSDE